MQTHGNTYIEAHVYKSAECVGQPWHSPLRGPLSLLKSFDKHALSACGKPGMVPTQEKGEAHSPSRLGLLSPSSRFQFLMRTLAKDTTSLSEQCLRTPLTATPILVVCKARGSRAGLPMGPQDWRP